jgi:hypothetical protein
MAAPRKTSKTAKSRARVKKTLKRTVAGSLATGAKAVGPLAAAEHTRESGPLHGSQHSKEKTSELERDLITKVATMSKKDFAEFSKRLAALKKASLPGSK